MTNPTPKRFRPRFSIRTQVIVVTLVCCYAACWGPTKNRGATDVWDYCGRRRIENDEPLPEWVGAHDDAKATMPLVVGFTPFSSQRRHYYFWFFGYVAKLPYEREILVDHNHDHDHDHDP